MAVTLFSLLARQAGAADVADVADVAGAGESGDGEGCAVLWDRAGGYRAPGSWR
ncbi:hypothetical protein AB0L74_31540 [Streptomyces sp. NPDC052020]|uniref:hypothetical protein n=1 Tax=Streptomyces sp. NPDC052020 TaxID=3155677 RepID=UPI0034458173